MADLPAGTVTFLFTDIEGSTNLARRLGNGWPKVLAEHNAVLRRAIEGHSGTEVSTSGDSFFAVFRSASDGVAATVEAQRALAARSGRKGHRFRYGWASTRVKGGSTKRIT